MLKIKDNVDLKELEKFGFIDEEQFNNMNCYYTCSNYVSKCKIGKHNRKIWIDGFSDKELIILYDLIKADIVEKLED